jgi:hypothetical protein|tara:strand:- start:61093 stop:61389 length:297 start_codon:yes stop_codon:yes gene_type:complete
MRRANSNTNILATLLNKIISNPKIADKLDNIKAIETFDELVGKNIQKYITETNVYNKKLFVKIKSSTVRNELSYQKNKIISEINKTLGKTVLLDIILK